MPYIRHESLFSLQDLYHMDREKRFDVIFATIDLAPALSVINLMGAKARLHFNLVTLVYNSMKLAVDHMNKQLKSQAA